MDPLRTVPPALVLLALLPAASAATMERSFEGGMDVEITYPAEIAAGRGATVSVLVQNNGWEEKRDVTLDFGAHGTPGLAVDPPGPVGIARLAQGSSWGESVRLHVPESASPGKHFLNVRYSHVLVANNETPQPAVLHDVAIPVTVKGEPGVVIRTTAPGSIFADAEFPMEVSVSSPDVGISDVTARVIPPADVGFRGETSHAFSRIEGGSEVSFSSRIVTPAGGVETERWMPFEVVVEYTDDVGERKADSQTVSVVLRPRTFMELTTDGGIWIGGFFIAPYVSIGTLVGIPAGALLSLLIRRRKRP